MSEATFNDQANWRRYPSGRRKKIPQQRFPDPKKRKEGRAWGRHKRTEAEMERDLVIVTDYYLQGYKLSEIAVKLKEKTKSDYTLSHVTIFHDVKEVVRRWRETALEDINDLKISELKRINSLEKLYHEAYERSCKLRTTKETQSRPIRTGGAELTINSEGNLEVGDEQQTDLIFSEKTKTEQPVGDPRFLDGILKCIDQRCKILGLYAKQQDERTQVLAGDLGTPELFKRFRSMVEAVISRSPARFSGNIEDADVVQDDVPE